MYTHSITRVAIFRRYSTVLCVFLRMTQEMASTAPLYVHSDYIWASDEHYSRLSPEYRQHTHEVNTVSNCCAMDIKADAKWLWPYPYISNTYLQVWPHTKQIKLFNLVAVKMKQPLKMQPNRTLHLWDNEHKGVSHWVCEFKTCLNQSVCLTLACQW